VADRSRPLTADRVVPLLPGRFGRPYRWSEECASTQDELRDAGLPDGAVAVTEHQTGGRGRSGRSWSDVAGRSLLLSVLLRPPAGGPVEQLSLVVGLAVAEAIEATTGLATTIKWPNDVLVGERKVAGILLESSGETVICGIGVNVAQDDSELPAGTRLPSTSLRVATGRAQDRLTLLVTLLASLESRYETWLAAALAPLLPELERRDALRGKAVTIGSHTGTAGGIASDGRLRILTPEGETLVASGEVVLQVSD
jgi:BirA family biotin operon repressor/biotin-[acetyl-CoA-carboxylase] ligase